MPQNGLMSKIRAESVQKKWIQNELQDLTQTNMQESKSNKTVYVFLIGLYS